MKFQKSYPCKRVYLVLSGEIYAESHMRTYEQNQWLDKDLKEKKLTLFNLKSLLYEFEKERIRAGEYQIKFSFKLPDQIEYCTTNVKGSQGLNNEDSKQYLMYVRYNIVALFLSTSDKKKSLVHKQPIIIFKEIDYNFENEVEETTYFTSCYCISQGFLDMRITLDKKIYKPKELINILFQYDNANISKKITKIRWSACRKFILDKIVYQKDLQTESLDLSSKEYKFSFLLPIALSPTHKSVIIQVGYFIVVEVFFGKEKSVIECEFGVQTENIWKSGDDNDSLESQLSDVNKEAIIAEEVNWQRCNSKFDVDKVTKQDLVDDKEDSASNND